MVAPKRDIAKKAAPSHLEGRLSYERPLLIDRVFQEHAYGVETRFEITNVIAQDPLDHTADLTRARNTAEWLRTLKLSRSPESDDPAHLPDMPFVLVLDQPSDAPNAPSIFDMQEMLVFAQTELLNANVAILTCPGGYFEDIDDPRLTLLPPETNLYNVLEHATSVYTHSSGDGADAIFSGHRPRVFGAPWYSNLDLTDDEHPNPYSTRKLTRAQLFYAAFMQATSWTEGSALLEVEKLLARLEARDRANREDAGGYVASNILPWKRPFLRAYFGNAALEITNREDRIDAAQSKGMKHIVWGPSERADLRLEDGFLRSRGLGAALVRPTSLTLDDLGIYFDPSRPSRLETLIAESVDLTGAQRQRTEHFLARLAELNLSKYNVGSGTPALPDGHRVLVVGQVEDDASITYGTTDTRTNAALLKAARDAHPDAVLVYKPHPDVEAGLRRGRVRDADTLADVIAKDADPLALIDACDEVWTMTSLMGFEAMLRGKPVTCLGAPFYAGWGLTTDLGDVPARRTVRPTLLGLAHATLIAFPRYFDPATGDAISPEEALEQLAHAPAGRSPLAQSVLVALRKLRARLLGIK
ncbi:capsular polysaccharide biosynthesis protein [Celeribacter litoreus]|uniref:capsular polysaccharide biosynthesis protein n=1 Tax=Celeribacter litoreus TaxID=2876714 RepID=UPI001CCFBBE8|nr:capsular polysaccharide biosynthesis protein [Celeribacter litoreus]MCA0043021.1 capsular polysaccharide biosynthesis protein [Celeribacter litoreus]